MIRYLVRSFLSNLRQTPSLFLLSLLGVSLGVASVLSVQIINQNAIGAFSGSIRAVSGESDLTVVGQGATFPEDLYPEVLGSPGVLAAWPIYRVNVALTEEEGFLLQVLGVDLLAPVRLPWGGSSSLDLSKALLEPGWMAVTPALAREKGWEVGHPVEVTSGSRSVQLVVGALVDFQRVSPLASRKMVVMDIAQVQNLLGVPDALHQIDIRLRDGVEAAGMVSRLSKRLGPSVRILTPGQRERQAADLMSAFRLNLTALSLISLLVGLFLIHTSTQASLVRRRLEFGLLRSVGATRGQVLGLILAEASLLGLLGVGLGLFLGYAVASASVDQVSSTLTNLYLLQEIETLRISPFLYLMAASIGLGGALAGALLPALDMSRRDSHSLLTPFSLQRQTSALALPLFCSGAGLLAAAAVWFWWLGQAWRPAGFVLAVAVLAAIPLLTPLILKTTCRILPASGFGFLYSVRTLGLRLQSASFAVSSLAIAVSMLIGITLMVGSFRKTLEVWVDTSMQADVYITTLSWQADPGASLDEQILGALWDHPEVRAVDRFRRLPVSRDGQRLYLAGVDMNLPGGQTRFPLLEGEREEAFRRVRSEGFVLISEPLARKARLGIGDQLEIHSAAGPIRFPVAGIFYDYSSEVGWAAMDLAIMEARFGKGPLSSVSLYLEDNSRAEEMADELRARFGEKTLRIRSNRSLREEIFRIFDQTFAVVRLLQGLSLLIAVCGIMLTLLVLASESVSEIALYRALGSDRGQIFRHFLGKGMGMGLCGLFLGTTGGLVLAAILIFLINRTYFGWTIQPYWPAGSIGEQFFLILLGAFVASLYPALRASKTPARELSRDDL